MAFLWENSESYGGRFTSTGDYLPIGEASISPLDRGFLFGDGIYEVIPSYAGRLVGFIPHLQRMQNGLDAIEIRSPARTRGMA